MKPCRFKKLSRPLSHGVLLDFHREAGWQMSQTDIAKALEKGPHIHWVALEQNGYKVAIARIEFALPAFAFASDVVVRQTYRGRGVGRQFVGHIERYGQSQGAACLIVHPDAAARLFWIGCGYEPDPKAPDFLKKDCGQAQALKT